MRTNIKKLIGAGAVAGLVATGGSAYTASNTVNGENLAGYGDAVVAGASTSAIEHTLSAAGTTITSTSLTFTTDLPAGAEATAGFDGTLWTCDISEGAVGADTAEGTSDDGVDTAVCTYTTAFSSESATSFQVAVS